MNDEDFYARLKTLIAAYSTSVEKSKVSEEQPPARVEYERAEQNTDTFLNGAAGLTETLYDVEVGGPDDNAVQIQAAAIKAGLNGFSGAMGSTVALGCWVSDHSDDYEPHLLDADEGTYLATFRVQVIEG